MIQLCIDTRDADEHHKNALFCVGLDGSVNQLTRDDSNKDRKLAEHHI
jgi:hypothetical protein